jgi:hypothetical protein
MKKFNLLTVIIVSLLFFSNQLLAQNSIVGTYYYHSNHEIPLENVNVDLFNSNDVWVASTVTNPEGLYSFDGITDGEYYVKASTTMEAGGINLFDALLVFYDAQGWIELDEIQKAAADVDADNVITFNDFIIIINDYLIWNLPFPVGDWQFEQQNINVASRGLGDTIACWGTSTGDVEGIWLPSGRDIVLMNSNYYEVDDHETNNYAIASNYSGYVNGFNLNLSFVKDLKITNISGPDENFNYSIDENNGIIKVSWLNENNGTSKVSGEELFVIEVENLTENINFEQRIFEILPEGLVLDSENNKMGDIEIRLPLLQNKQTMNIGVDTYPNPTVDMLNFNIKLNKQCQASLSVYDLNGKLVNYTENISLNEGEQIVSFSVVDLIPGNYVYSFDLKGDNEGNVKGRFVKSK